MKRNPILTVFWILIIYLSASATIINIPDDYETIQEGIDASTDGDTVLVQPGAYWEYVSFGGHNIVLGSLFLTTGDTTYITRTVIDGNSSGTVVTFDSGEDSTSIIKGVTIRNGLGQGIGGGILCINSSPVICNNVIEDNSAPYLNYDLLGFGGGIALDLADADIINNVIEGNWATSDGGGIYSSRSYANISDNLITHNSAWSGGGIFCGEYRNTIHGNKIISNVAYGIGGGIVAGGNGTVISNNILQQNHVIGEYVSGGGGIFGVGRGATITNNLIIGNQVEVGGNYGFSNGGGIYFANGEPDIMVANNIICFNEVYDRGGGLLCGNESEITFENNVIFGNVVHGALYYNDGGGIYCQYGSIAIISNTILWNNEAGEGSQIFGAPQITFSNIQGGWEGEGNIDVDPLFRDPDNGDFHLKSTACGDPYDSPCIDVGHPDIIDSLLDCSWGLGTILSDMGAYGGGDSATVGINDQQPRVPDRFALLQNYPNPFNAKTIIRYNLPSDSDVTIEIYDILGRKVETLVDDKQPAGYHRAIWNAVDRSSGIYFYRIQAGKHSETRKMLLIK